MNVFVVNLDKNTERMQKTDAQLRRFGIQYERFPAVYGRDMSEAEKKRVVSRFGWWCVGGRCVMDGEIGCALSHYAIYRIMIQRGIDYACIVEDDVEWTDDMPRQLQRVEDWIDGRKPIVVLLTNYTSDRGDGWEIKEAKRDSSTESYIITRPAAEAILRINTPIRAAIDSWHRWRIRGGVVCYHAFPTVCRPYYETNYTTDVFTGPQFNPAAYPLLKKMLYKSGRLIGKVIDTCWR